MDMNMDASENKNGNLHKNRGENGNKDEDGAMNVDTKADNAEAMLDELITRGQRLLSLFREGEAQETIKSYLKNTPNLPLWVQDEDTGWTALHFAAEREDDDLLELLIASGAVWNLVDRLGNTAGDIALSLNNSICYQRIRDAGVRSEFLLHLLDSREDEAMEDDEDIDEDNGASHKNENRDKKANVNESGNHNAVILRSKDATPAGSNEAFLKAELTFTTDAKGQELCLVDSGTDEIGVMMGWERPIMEETVRQLHKNNDTADFRVLNCGFGLGIIDTLFETWPNTSNSSDSGSSSSCNPPSLHVIIEPHPDVLSHMRKNGWYSRPNVRILEGKWQDWIDSEEIMNIGGFDAIYTDTFSENYKDLYAFFEKIPDLLRGPDSTFSFFNGLGATNPLFYDVYTNLAEMHLKELGCSVAWTDLDVHTAQSDGIWGETRKYFSLPYCRIPLVKMET